jgi:hypothetical protein
MECQLLIVVLLSVVEPRIGCSSILEVLWTSCRWWWSIRVIWIPGLVVWVLLPLLLSFRHGGLLFPQVPQCAVVACTPAVIASVCRLFWFRVSFSPSWCGLMWYPCRCGSLWLSLARWCSLKINQKRTNRVEVLTPFLDTYLWTRIWS